MIKKIGIIGFAGVLLVSMVGVSHADPRTVPTQITQMRPYTTGDYFVTVASNRFTTGATCTTTYRVQSTAPGAKAVIASLLTAFSLGQDIQIEVPTPTGCQGFGTPIQSVFLVQ